MYAANTRDWRIRLLVSIRSTEFVVGDAYFILPSKVAFPPTICRVVLKVNGPSVAAEGILMMTLEVSEKSRSVLMLLLILSNSGWLDTIWIVEFAVVVKFASCIVV